MERKIISKVRTAPSDKSKFVRKTITVPAKSQNVEIKQVTEKRIAKKRKISEISDDVEKVLDSLTVFMSFSDQLEIKEIQSFLKLHNIQYKHMKFLSKRRVCYVDFENKESFDKALDLNGEMVSNVKVLIHEAKNRPTGPHLCKRMKLDDSFNGKRIILKNLPDNLCLSELKRRFPTAVSMKFPRKKGNTKKFKSYGFLEFKEETEADTILEMMQETVIGGCTVQLSKVLDKQALPDSKKGAKESCSILVKQLSFSTNCDMLKNAFPNSKGARLVFNPKTKKSKGYGFVEFENEADAQDAISMMNGKELGGRKIIVSYANKKNIKKKAKSE